MSSEIAVPATSASSRYETSGEIFMDLNLNINPAHAIETKHRIMKLTVALRSKNVGTIESGTNKTASGISKADLFK
jgi:hypothetical protein